MANTQMKIQCSKDNVGVRWMATIYSNIFKSNM